jgi:NAD(P)-dependent dehydrogenase (short-subunit alcohol dehydrogenase family)
MTAADNASLAAQALDFTGKTVLVTGGGVGIGRAIAEAFADTGAHVVIAEIDAARADQAEAAMLGARVIRCDVRQRGVGAMLAERIAAETGRLDVLVNNVGHFVHARPFSMLEDDEADEILDTNLGQLLRMTRAMIPLLRKGAPGSSIINITSIEAHRGIPYCSVYAAAKWAVTGFTKSLALELGPEAIRVNTIAPETTDTPQVALDFMIPRENRAHEELDPARPLWPTERLRRRCALSCQPARGMGHGQHDQRGWRGIGGGRMVSHTTGGMDQRAADFGQRAGHSRHGSVNDLAALRQTAQRYALGADRRDKALWREVLAEDVEISGPGLALIGLEASLGSIDHLSRAFVATRHIVHDMDVIVDGDNAWGETRSTAEHRIGAPEGDTLLVWAIRYQDRWRRAGEIWKFTRRTLFVDWEELRPIKGTST